MFLLLCLFIVVFGVLFIWLVYKFLEMEKDIDVLYNRYSDELNKIILLNLNRNGD